MLRENQKIDTLREIVKLINHIHYMTTKSEYEALLEQSKYYLKQVDQLKVLAELKSIYEIDDNATNISIGSILNYVYSTK
jgi:hypothetical protein